MIVSSSEMDGYVYVEAVHVILEEERSWLG